MEVREGETLLTEGDGMLVEETGPVDYCQDEGEGVDDSDLEQLTYEGDPLLLQSDYEDEEGKLFDTIS